MEAMEDEDDWFSQTNIEYAYAAFQDSESNKKRKIDEDDKSAVLEAHYTLRRPPTAASIDQGAIEDMKAKMRANQATAEEVIDILTQLKDPETSLDEKRAFELQLKTITDKEMVSPSDRDLHGGVNIFELIAERNFDQDYDWEIGNFTLNTLVVKRSSLSGLGLFYMGSKDLPPSTTITWYPGPTVRSSEVVEDANKYVIRDNFNTGWLYDASSCVRRRNNPINNQGLAHMCNSAHPKLPAPYDKPNCNLVSSSRFSARASLRRPVLQTVEWIQRGEELLADYHYLLDIPGVVCDCPTCVSTSLLLLK